MSQNASAIGDRDNNSPHCGSSCSAGRRCTGQGFCRRTRLSPPDGEEMHRPSSLPWSLPRRTVLGRLVASGAGATIVLLAAIGPVAAVEPPDITRTVEGTVQNIAVEEPGDTDGVLQIATAVEVAGELYDLSDADVPAVETGQAVELELRSEADGPVAEALELAAAGTSASDRSSSSTAWPVSTAGTSASE